MKNDSGNERILFIDDEKFLVTIAQDILEYFGYTVVAKTDSKEALKLFSARSESFDLVITDQTMPQMTGLEIAREMIRIRPDIPVIICSGYSEVLTSERIEAAGVRGLVNKPLDPAGFAQTVRNVLNNRSGSSGI